MRGAELDAVGLQLRPPVHQSARMKLSIVPIAFISKP